MRVFTCEVDHILGLTPQPEQQVEMDFLGRNAAQCVAAGWAFSFWTDDGRCVCCAGVAGIWPGCAQAWAMFSIDAGPFMLAITRFWRNMLDNVVPFRRVQAVAICDFEPANRWLQLLGFEVEAERMKGYDWAGRDNRQYARVRA